MNTQPLQSIGLLKLVVCIGFAAGFLVSKPLWLADRLYPLAPVFSWLPTLPPSYGLLLYYSLFILLAGIAASRTPLYWIKVFLVAITYLAMTDQSRWHPWFYWYSFMMLALAYAFQVPDNYGKQQAALNVCRIILIASYVWAGLQKINVTFYYNLFPWVLSTLSTSAAMHHFWSKVPFSIPIIEISIGFFLLVPKYRKIGIAMAIAMHLTILTLLGPLGKNVNDNIWTWNLSLLFLVVIVFTNTDVSVRKLLQPSSVIHFIVIVLFLIMPAFTFINWWDAYPGFSLYSGSQRAAYIQLDDRSKRYLPDRLQSYVDDKNHLVASKWAMHELNTPDYAEPRIYRNLLTYVCGYIKNTPNDMELVVLSKPDRLTGLRHTEFISHCTKESEPHA